MNTHATVTKFSHVREGDTEYKSGGLRDFFLYRDLGIADATGGQVIAHLVKANMQPEDGTGWHRHECDFRVRAFRANRSSPSSIRLDDGVARCVRSDCARDAAAARYRRAR